MALVGDLHRRLLDSIAPTVSTAESPLVVETVVLDLDEAALLHRDPPAERSRLRTRGFVNGIVRCWIESDTEVLRVQITLIRFADETQAALAEADSWSELLAGGATFRHVRTGSSSRARQVAAVADPDGNGWHALVFETVGEVVVGVAVLEPDDVTARERAVAITAEQLARLQPPSPSAGG